MKAKRDHRVPLSGRSLAILHDVQRLSDGTDLVFRSPRGKPLSNMTLSKLIKELGIAAVPHGFRSSFRDWAAERTNTPREVVEAALAHTVQNPTEAAYARSDLFEHRRRLMNDWAGYLDNRDRTLAATLQRRAPPHESRRPHPRRVQGADRDDPQVVRRKPNGCHSPVISGPKKPGHVTRAPVCRPDRWNSTKVVAGL